MSIEKYIGKESNIMARENCKLLDTGDFFPELKFKGLLKDVALPDDFGERWNVLLFYRGQW